MNVKLSESQKIKLLNSEDVYSIMQKVLLRERKIDRNKEHFWVIGLANNHQILYIELISLGTVNKTLVDPMEVFSIALQKRSVRVILVHNHPSGDLTPSEADKELTDHLYQVGKFLNVPVLDHLIIAEKEYYSFLDGGLLEILSQSKKYVLRYQEEARIRKEAQALGEERGKKKQAREIARTMKRKGYQEEHISELTGLTKEEIRKLKI